MQKTFLEKHLGYLTWKDFLFNTSNAFLILQCVICLKQSTFVLCPEQVEMSSLGENLGSRVRKIRVCSSHALYFGAKQNEDDDDKIL